VKAQLTLADAAIGPIHLSDQPEIDAGFRLMYELKFPEARKLAKLRGTPRAPAAYQ
jgi:hypothetical protein